MKGLNETASVIGDVIILPGDRYFPEGVTVSTDGTFYVGSLEEGCIMKAPPGSKEAVPFIEPGANGLVSVLGLYADDARGILWACSADAGNGKLAGNAPPGVKAFSLDTGEPRGSYDLPGGGFPNDLTIDDKGNVYVTDSLSPRLLRLAVGANELQVWIEDPRLGVEKFSLNGIDYARDKGVIYTVNQVKGQLLRVDIEPDGSSGAVSLIDTSQDLRLPDGLKVLFPDVLAAGEMGAGGISVMRISGDTAEVSRVPAGLDVVSTFAFFKGSAWVVEGQADHFWQPEEVGPDATPPFRVVEVPLNLE